MSATENARTMKLFQIVINYDSGGSDEYILEAPDARQAAEKVYLDLGYDPGEVYVEELPPEDKGLI